MFLGPSCCGHAIKELVHAFSCAYIELWMHLRSLESTQEARVALGCASSNTYASFVLSKLLACIHLTNRFHVAVRLIQYRTSVTHSATPRVPLICSYHILTSSVIYY